MNKRARLGWLTLGLALLLGAVLLGRAGRTEANPPEPGWSIDQNEAVWWNHIGAKGGAVANFGPLLDMGDGERLRRWVLVVHLPDSSEPLSCLQGVLSDDNAEAIWAKGEQFRVEIAPVAGASWGSVFAPEDLDVSFEGFD